MHAKPNTRESKKKKIKGVVVNFCEIWQQKNFWGRTSKIFKGWGGKLCLGLANNFIEVAKGFWGCNYKNN